MQHKIDTPNWTSRTRTVQHEEMMSADNCNSTAVHRTVNYTAECCKTVFLPETCDRQTDKVPLP